MYDFTTQLSTMAACSATFIAIIGGLIANKVISITAEKQTAKKRCKQIDEELKVIDNKISTLSQWIDTSDAMNFIEAHLDELVRLKPLSEVYDESKNNALSFERLFPYWEQALDAIQKYIESFKTVKDGDFSSREEYKKDFSEFQINVCKKFRPSYDHGLVLVKDLLGVSSASNETRIYNEKCKELEKLVEEKARLVNEEIFLSPRENLVVDIKTKRGLFIFLSTTVLTVILPIVFMIFNPTNSAKWFNVEKAVSVVFFIVGVCVMCWYIYYLFPKDEKNAKEEKEEKMQKNTKLTFQKKVIWTIITSSILTIIFLLIDYFDIPTALGIDIDSFNLDFWSIFISNIVVISLFLITFILFDKRKLLKEKMADYAGTILLLDTYRECESYLNILNNIITNKDDIIKTNTREMVSSEPFATYHKVFELFSDGHIPLERYNAYTEVKRMYESFVFVCSVENGIRFKGKMHNEIIQKITDEKEKLKLYRESLK